MNKKLRLLLAASALLLVGGAAPLFNGLLREREPAEIRLEAEDGELAGPSIGTDAAGYSGTGYVAGFVAEGDAVVFKLEAPKSGLYEIRLGYRSESGDKRTNLGLNGEPLGELVLKQSGEFTETSAGKAFLRQGENRIVLSRGWGYYDIDYLTYKETKPVEAPELDGSLVNKNATPEAKRLMRYLADSFGKATLSGQQEYKNLGWIYELTGKEPAVMGFDLIEYSPSRVQRGAQSQEIEHMLDWHAKGGIATLCWHWNAPKDLIDEPGKEWWSGFYTRATAFDVEKAMDDPQSEEHKLLLSDIEAVAVQLQRLYDAKVPVLWRPLHEAEGGWFWWGAKGAEPAKKLYRLLYDKLAIEHGFDNLIWVWNSEDPQWYPGDDVVDIVSVDHYPEPGDHGAVNARFERLVRLSGGHKLVALAENGAIPDPDQMKMYGALWSWFCTWTGEFLRDGRHNSPEFLRKVYADERVVTLDELPWNKNG